VGTGVGSIWRDGPAEEAFRRELRAWLAARAPFPDPPRDAEARAAFLHDWHRTLAAAGYVGLSLPATVGGRGLDARYEAIRDEELGLAGAPPAPPIGHLTHALARHGTPAQRAEHLPGLLSGETRWCQGFSEPDAGSDLASLRTRATRTAGGWRIDGHKIWTSLAVWADRCLLLARTDPAAAPHRGLSLLVVPMDAPGVTCRPVVTASGTREFAEVFLDGVEVPADAVVGAPGEGWRIATDLLAHERGPADIGWVARLRRLVTVTDAAREASGTRLAGPARDRWARVHAELRVLELHVRRSLARRRDGAGPGAEGSLDKLLLTRVDQLVHDAVLGDRGAAALCTTDADLDAYLMARAQSVFGGTSQIQRSIVGERVLGLPREPRHSPANDRRSPCTATTGS
jgi:alkylation response protein AidB-like acyl-CoA dehydrogenase